eukprot:GHVU01121245.1.p3 GENE.GHVU01121245.1~~GHVU01121245.1.p3  ORF type:complete len:120 (-),score=8.88 GHVU01121245.1:393-752(-)
MCNWRQGGAPGVSEYTLLLCRPPATKIVFGDCLRGVHTCLLASTLVTSQRATAGDSEECQVKPIKSSLRHKERLIRILHVSFARSVAYSLHSPPPPPPPPSIDPSTQRRFTRSRLEPVP